ncbi:MAG TPA: phosphotransferase [Candidatus Binataceae bacterium]|nr:phosphotransferase [Candidatus Binataceae bacterium]
MRTDPDADAAVDAGRLRWAREAAARRWPGAAVAKIDLLRGDASARRFWRIHLARGAKPAPASAILVDLGPDDLPRYARVLGMISEPLAEPPWINLHRFLTELGAPVPALYAFAPALRAMLVEDAGEVALFDILRARGAGTADLLRAAVELLFVLHVEGARRIDSRCLAARINYDARLFRWELKEFLELGCARIAPGADPAALAPELDALARSLGEFPRVFSHRDYHGGNLYVQHRGGRPILRVIDFQDALMAPGAQDLAVLLTTRDAGSLIAPALEDKLIDFYYTGLVRRGAADLSAADFRLSYRLCVLQHALKMIGRFILFEREGKPGYTAFLPHLIAQARRILDGPELRGYPRLAAALRAAASPGGASNVGQGRPR